MSELTCLIVDDEPTIRGYLAAILTTHGLRTLEAADAPKALRLIQKLNGGVDLVVTDVKMPGDMDGLDLAYAVRNAYPTIAVIVMSGYPETSLQRTDRDLGNFEFVAKPFKKEALLKAIENLGI